MDFMQGKKGAAIVAALFIFAGAGVWWWSQNQAAPSSDQQAGPAVTEEPLDLVTENGVKRITVEVARSPAAQAKGLMFRTSLPDDRGMLFPHDAPREVSMWMRDTYIPLDMIFIRQDGTVHRIEANTEPFSETVISSNGKVSAVLEVAGGAAKRLGLKPGDLVRHPHFAGKAEDPKP